MTRTKEEQAAALKGIYERIKVTVTEKGIHSLMQVPDRGVYTIGGQYLNLPDIVVLFDGSVDSAILNDILAVIRNSSELHDLVYDTPVIKQLERETEELDVVRVMFRRVRGTDLFQHFAFNRNLNPNSSNWLQVYLPNEPSGALPGEPDYIYDNHSPDWNFEDNTRRFYSDDVPVRPGDVKHDA